MMATRAVRRRLQRKAQPGDAAEPMTTKSNAFMSGARSAKP